MSSAGKFSVEISEPHPCWVRILYDGQEIHGVRHTELRDLQFAIDRAIADARRKLGKDAHEID
jgi:hypothetical protein